jgi:outer membrane protein assembly factor BamB
VLVIGAGCAGVDDPDGWPPPVQDGANLYLSVDDGELIAVDADFGRLWVFPNADEQECGDSGPETRDLKAIYGPPVVADGTVYFGAWDGFVYALDADSGECLWDHETDDPIIGGVVADSGRVYAASTDENLYVLDASDGEELERAHVGDVWSTPLLLDGTLYVGAMDGELHALDAETLEETWDGNFTTEAGLLTDPRAVNGTIVVGGIGGTLYGIDSATGDEQWSFGGANNWYWGPVAVDEEGGRVYATNMDSNIYAIDTTSGDPIWEFDGDALFRAGAVLAGDTVVAVDDDGFVFGLDAATGDLIWNGPTELDKSTFATPLVFDDATALIVARNGDVFTVDTADGRLSTVTIGS